VLFPRTKPVLKARVLRLFRLYICDSLSRQRITYEKRQGRADAERGNRTKENAHPEHVTGFACCRFTGRKYGISPQYCSSPKGDYGNRFSSLPHMSCTKSNRCVGGAHMWIDRKSPPPLKKAFCYELRPRWPSRFVMHLAQKTRLRA
jgi:hypothetical protein